MTLEQLEEKVNKLARQVAELRREIRPLRPWGGVQETFGMLGDEPLFEEIVRHGRAYRDEVNLEKE